MVFLIPITFPPGAQAAHTSDINEHIQTRKTVEKQESKVAISGLFSRLYLTLICSHAVNIVLQKLSMWHAVIHLESNTNREAQLITGIKV